MGTEIALLFGAVRYPAWGFLDPLRGCCTVICADGDIQCAREAGFIPQLYIGDSVSGGQPAAGVEAVLLKPEKDLTDLQAAYEQARDRGFRRVILTACTGGRQDHHLANLQLLETAYDDGIAMEIWDPWNKIHYLRGGEMTLQCQEFRYFSIIPMDRMLEHVEIVHAKYPLNVSAVTRGDSLTVSNEALEGTARIRIGNGAAWIILSERIS